MSVKNTKHLKIFTDPVYSSPGRNYVPLLYPFWGFIEENKNSLDFDRFKDFTAEGNSLFSLSSKEESNAFVLPCEWRPNYPEAKSLALLAKELDKPLIVFYNSDSDQEITLDHAIIFRTSLYASRRKSNEFALPGWSSDFMKKYLGGHLALRTKTTIPTVGYTGYIDYYNVTSAFWSLGRFLKNGFKTHAGAYLRGKAVRHLLDNHLVKTNFILRERCQTGISDQPSRLEYVRNIINSDYTLVVRGGGNFSYRLYEVLSLGRIPVFVNTDCVLPYDDIINWRNVVVWIEAQDIANIAKIVSDFHSRLSHSEFRDLQIQARHLYENWLSPTGFYSNMWRCLP